MAKIKKPGEKTPAKKKTDKEKVAVEEPKAEEEKVIEAEVVPETEVKPAGSALPVARKTDSIALSSLEDLMTFSKAVAKSAMFPGIEDEFGASAVIEYGREIGLKPIIALQTIHVIPSKRGSTLAIKGSVLAMMAKEAGINIEILQKDTKGCKLTFSRGNEAPHTSAFTQEDARRAGLLHKDNYMKWPEDMYYWRAIARGVKVFDPGLALGISTVEEVEELPIAKGKVSDKKEKPKEEKSKVTIKKEKPAPEPGADPGPEPPPEETEEPKEPMEEKVETEMKSERLLVFENTIKDIKMLLEKAEIKESLFKKYLGEELQPVKPDRNFVQINEWGHWSFHEGKLVDLAVIIENFDWLTNEYFESATFKESAKEAPPGKPTTDPI